MALVLAEDTVKETTSTTGIDVLLLSGAVSGFSTFAVGVGANNTTYYTIEDANGNFEIGVGTVRTSPDRLERNIVLASSTGSKLALSSGTHTVESGYASNRDTFFETIKYTACSPKSIYVPYDVFASREVNASTGTFSHNITAPSGRLGETLNVPTGVLNTLTMDGANITSVITSSDSFADVNTAFMTAAAIEDRYSSSGAGTMNTVKRNDVQVGGSDIATLNFSSDFGVAEDPDTEIDITIGTLNQNTTGSAGSFSSAVTITLSGDVTGSANFTSAGDTATISTTIADAGLTSIAGLTTAANKMIYTTALDTYAVADLTAAARTLLDDATVGDMRTTLGVAIGSDVQAYDAGLNSIAGLTTAANKMIYTTNSDTYAVADLTATARTLLDDATVGDMRTTLGVYASTTTLNNITTPDGDLSLNSNKITNLTDPTGDQDAATKSYVDAIKSGLDVKDSCRVATTTAGTLSTSFANGQTVDGVTLVTGDRILIKDQATGSENGIYTVNSSGAPTRATDFDSNAEVTSGAFTFVEEGTVNGDGGFVLTTNDPITVGTTSLTFVQFSGAGQITAGTGLSKSGNTLNVNIGSDVQAYDAGLTSIAGLATAANKMIYTSASDTYAVTDLTAAARTVLDDSTVSDMRTTLGVAIGSDVQAYDAGLTSIAGLATDANKMIYTTASDTYAVADLTAAARTVLDDSTVSDMRTTLGVAIGSDVQAHNDILDDLAGLTQAANKLPYFDAATTAATTDLTAFGRSLIDDADATAARGTLGLGSIATLSSIDISANTNLGVTAPIVLTDDTLSLSASLNDLSNVSTDELDAGNLLAYNAASGAFVNSSLLAIDTVNDRVGIGTSSPEVKLHIDGDAAQEAQIRLEQHNNTADAPDIRIRRSRGTHASPSVLSANDYAFRLNVDIYDGSDYTNAGQLRWDNDGTTNNNSTNTVFGLQTRVSGTTADRITVDSTGNVIIAGNLDISDGNITNVGDIDCDSISVADAANGLNVDLSGANTGTGKITLKDNVASALDITESSNSYIKLNTQNKTDEVTYSKEAVEISKPLKCTQAIHSSISKTNAISTGQTLKGGGTGNVVTLDLASAGFFRVQLTANVDEIWFKNQSEGQKVIIRFEQDSTGSRTVDFSAFYAYDGTAVGVNFAGGTAPTLTTTASRADIIGFLNFGIPAGSVHYYNAVVIGQDFS